MGQAWCKERSCKAQDSKSPLDRVFVRCAHRIYPSLKEEGSVLGGATQRVTSSEIGYAGSPPREVLTRGRSIDSVDRPFHPSDWVDVNLEVPSPPRTSSVLTNLTVDTSPYPAATPTSSCSNPKNVTPVPPPRRKKINRGRPLPLKPDEIPENVTANLRRGSTSEEPLQPSVKSPKTTTSGDERSGDGETRASGRIGADDAKHEGRRTREIYEHKVNGTGRIISSDVVSGRRTSADKKTSRTSEPGHHHRKVLENEEYERFARSESIKGSSTPNRQDRRNSKELEKRIRDPSRDDDRTEANTRTKNYSTVSLPNYDELDVSRHPAKSTKDERGAGEKMKSKRPVRSSTGSLPAESFLSPFSEKTSVRLEDYIPRRGSVEHLSPYQVLGKLGCSENEVTDGGFMKYDPSKLEDWDLSDISNCDSANRRLSVENLPRIEIHDDEPAERGLSKGADVVDYPQNAETGEAETTELEVSCVTRDMTLSLQKPESFGMVPSPTLDSDKDPNDWFADPSRSLKHFDPPTMVEISQAPPTADLATSPVRREPFFLNEDLHRSALDTIGGSCRNGAVVRESDRSDQSRLIFGRSLSNESEPYDDPYESKELRAHTDVTDKLIRTISEESLPQEMLEGVDEEIVDFFDEKLAKDTSNKLKKDCQDQRVKTPPPSPEPKIKAQILDNDHTTLLKVLNDEAAEGSNLSSMTPSLTELEAALSDMLEKEDQPDEVTKRQEKADGKPALNLVEKLLEPKIVPSVEKRSAIDRTVMDQHRPASDDDILVGRTSEDKTDRLSVSLEQIFGDTESTSKTRKVSFCTWEDKPMTEVDVKNAAEPGATVNTHGATSPCSKDSLVESDLESDFFHCLVGDINVGPAKGNAIGDAPEKPVRLFPNLEDAAGDFPTPPRRRNRSSGVTKELIRSVESYPEDPDPRPDDRLI
ncbi:PREDICTED: uncharacterized protein LOC106749744 [Dinoponera quadriceps]|uniref:Uncharacterized protein LOC106749744 n=1 Tax=Dinoponera quadriceps TaxID=609295 RepID=A0A6P3Y4E0_DINQU|nr:PREDICTED: uncharacterized protein LOC106749744 [Dinoponera quadriceps]